MTFNQRQKEYYNRIAPGYNKLLLFDRDNRNHMIRTKAIVDSLLFRKSYSILEVGVGTGITAKHILSAYPYKSFTGIDLSEGMLGLACRELSGLSGVTLKIADMEKLPFPDESFDVVYCVGTIHHANKPFKALAEMVRVLKKNRALALVEPNRYSIYDKMIHPFRHNGENWSDINQREMINARFETAMKKLGLSGICVKNILYTIPKPDFLSGFYDKVDAVVGHIPIVNRMSMNLLVKGNKVSDNEKNTKEKS